MADAMPGSGVPSSNRNIMMVLSYLWLLALVPLVTEKEDMEVQWQAKHGIVLMIAEIVLWIVITGINVTTGFFLGCITAFLSLFVGLGLIILHILCIVKGVNGQRLIVPGLSEYANKL